MKAAVILIAAVLLILLIKYASSYSVYVSGNAGAKVSCQKKEVINK